jgi:lysylphosphatidylglycerol synthetase-like protein (DUF2156 family)
MKLNKKSFYALITVVFIVLTVIELFEYFLCDSSLFGLIYLITNFVIIFFLGMITINFNRASKIYRISKIFIVIIIGLFSSFLLKNIVYMTLDYSVYSSSLETSIFLTKNILKPIIYFLLAVLDLLEVNTLVKNRNGKGIFNLNFCKTVIAKFKKSA